MYKKMLVPLDGSKLAEVVFAYARELAGTLDLDLILFHVCRPEESELLPMHRSYVERAAEIVRRQSREVQERAGIQPGLKIVEAQVEMAVGHPAEEILNYAEKNDIDLILMATHGRSGIGRWAMGSVVDKVLRVSKVPVWLVPAGTPGEIVYDERPRRTILVPLDGSELAEEVLPHVETLAKQRAAELVDVVLLTVLEFQILSTSHYQKRLQEQEELEYRKRAEQYLSGVEMRLMKRGLRVKSEVLQGKPADEIVDYVNRNHFNLIVMATHGLSGLARWAYGSVADRVLHGVSSPIFLVRPR